MVTLKAICDLFTQELGCTGDVYVEVIKQAEENCGMQAAGTGSLFDRADAVCALLDNCTAAEAVASRSSDGGSSIGASSGAGGSSVVVAKRQKVQPAVAEEVVILKLPSSVPGNNTQALWDNTLMPRGDLSPAQSDFYPVAQEVVRPFMQEKLAAKGIPKKGIRLEQALKLMLSAPHLSTTLQEPPCKDAFMNLSGNACVRGCPSWDDKAAELAGLLLWFSLPQTDSSSPLELYQTDPYSKDYHLRLRQPNASTPAALAAAPTPAAPEHYEAGATPASETDVPPASEAGSDSALGGSTQASHAAAAPQTPAGPVAPAAPEAAPASTSTAARKQPAADQSN